MNIDEIIARLERYKQIKTEAKETVSVYELIEIVYGNRLADEHKARNRMVHDVIKAKRDAGYPSTCAFFRDVWPDALKALKASRAS